MQSAEFPGLANGDTAVTFDRNTALVREDLEFVSWDHPLLGDAMELMQSKEDGNACFALLDGGPPGLFLESIFVLESVAPRRLHVDRFLAPTPVRAISDQRAETVEDPGTGQSYEQGDSQWIVGHQATLRGLLSKMESTNEKTAEVSAAKVRKAATERLHAVMGTEIRRLTNLAKVNDAVRAQEILDTEGEMTELQGYIDDARIRLDACRLIWRGPSDRGVPSL
jgi:ATP-dependent helicase HepA